MKCDSGEVKITNLGVSNEFVTATEQVGQQGVQVGQPGVKVLLVMVKVLLAKKTMLHSRSSLTCYKTCPGFELQLGQLRG